jgi:hypothetical protein
MNSSNGCVVERECETGQWVKFDDVKFSDDISNFCSMEWKADCDQLREVFKEAAMVVESDEHYHNSIRNMVGDSQRAEENLFANLVRLANAVKAYQKTLVV